MNDAIEVHNSQTLENIIFRILDHKNTFWYVSRTGTVKQLQIYISCQTKTFCRSYDTTVYSKNLNRDTIEKEEQWQGSEGSGWMYDHYYKYGHIFSDRSSAFKYLKRRIDLNKNNLVKTARKVYNSYPEYHL